MTFRPKPHRATARITAEYGEHIVVEDIFDDSS
jgi:hypothetical protein